MTHTDFLRLSLATLSLCVPLFWQKFLSPRHSMDFVTNQPIILKRGWWVGDGMNQTGSHAKLLGAIWPYHVFLKKPPPPLLPSSLFVHFPPKPLHNFQTMQPSRGAKRHMARIRREFQSFGWHSGEYDNSAFYYDTKDERKEETELTVWQIPEFVA